MSHKGVKALVILGVLFLALVFVLPFLGGQDSQDLEIDDSSLLGGTSPTANLSGSQLSGSLALTLLQKDTALQNPAGIPRGHLYNLQTGSLTLLESEGDLSTQHSFSSSGSHVAYVSFGNKEDQDLDDLYVINSSVRGSALRPNESGASSETTRSDTVAFSKIAPEISNNGRVAFSSLAEGNPSAIDPRFADYTLADEWNIHLIDADGSEQVVAEGIYPHWVTEDSFVFLKNDGLYLYRVLDDTEENLVPLSSGKIGSNSMLDVSNDGSRIAWTLAESVSVAVLQVDDWGASEIQIRTRGTITEVVAFWPVLSPRGEYLALQTLDARQENILTDPQPRIIFYDMTTFQRLDVEIDLDNYEQLEMYITDWI